MTAVPEIDDGQGSQIIWSDWRALSVGRIWPCVVAAIGVLLVVMGAVLFSPDFTTSAIGASINCFG